MASRKRKLQDKPNMSRKCFPSDVIQYLGCSSVRTAVSSMPQIIQTPVFRHGNDFRHKWLWHDRNFLVTRNRWHARSHENTKKKHIARGYISSSHAQSLNKLTQLWSQIDFKGKRLPKLEDNENNAINLCRSSYDKDQETNVITFFAADFKVQGRPLSIDLWPSWSVQECKSRTEPKLSITELASEKSHYHTISSP